MALALDDFLSKKKEPTQVLDLSHSVVNSREELKKLLERVPEYRIRPEKVRPEEMRIRDRDFSFKSGKTHSARSQTTTEYSYGDPVPSCMQSVRLDDLSGVDINWKMLTTVRPKSKMEEELFSRFVDLGKMHLQRAQHDRKTASPTGGMRRSKNRVGIIECRVPPCNDCGEEFCSGNFCKELTYDCFIRGSNSKVAQETKRATSAVADKKGKKKKKKKKSKSKGKKKRRSKSAGAETDNSDTSQGK